ncbi:stress response NST1-like protein [Trema orientale]|uniref:Stress response NST1-like protein n=1 Tax=Trema orientale TaxID=63057 RepID=A0A2P5F9G9_TREOI|nr:stress response NST1-like protein [Trema orientale]
MCILCVIQKWSRRVATMLPWLVIPLIGLWALSQLLPPAFRFEITSPRLACVFVLLVTLFWYEILMPQLSAWRMRRNARLRERKRFEAIELQKLRKTATRRCRNCLTAYRDQNPGGGRFMCSYCGHISKRPVLDLPVPPGMSSSSILKDLVGKSGKILNGKVWSDNGWTCGQDWLENGNWVGGPVAGKSTHWRRNGSSLFGGDENCLAEKSYSGVVIFACNLFASFFLSVKWLLRKIFRVSSSSEDASSDADLKGLLAKRGENGGNFSESRGEKARRKAEEKRQARLEKELLEEEERKQREEVARLVEERRRLRDEKMEAEKDGGKTSTPVREKDTKKEAERKRQERRKEKDKGSSKSNSDVEELDKKTGKESERKKDFDKKSEADRREHQKSGTDLFKGQTMEMGHGIKHTAGSNFTRGNAGARYLDRMRGTILSSSKAFSGGSFFGRGTSTAANMVKESKPNNSIDQPHMAVHRKDICPPERVAVKSCMNVDDKNTNRPVHTEPQPGTAPKKSWQQLFTRSPVPPSSNANVISRPNSKFQVEVQSPQLSSQSLTAQSFDNPINFGSPFTLSTYPNVPTSSSLGFSPAIEPIFPRVGEGPREHIPEEPELFEDPSYIPDPVSLLGPVSESLDNFQLDLGTSRAMDFGLERPRTLKSVSATSDVNKPSPIESPLSREKHISSRFPTTPQTQSMHKLPANDANANETSMWQMWNTLPLGQDGLGLVGGPASWLRTPELNRPSKDDFVHPSAQKTMASLFTNDEQVISGTRAPQNTFLGNGQNGGTFSPVNASRDPDSWLQRGFFPPLSAGENHSLLKSQEEATQNEMIYGSPSRSVNHPFEHPPANGWSKKEWAVQGTGEGAGRPSTGKPQVGGPFPAPDVQSLW